MKHYFPTIAALGVSLMGTVLVPTMKASDIDKKTKITIDQPINVQGTVLLPGSYVMKLLGSPADERTVQIFNAEENHLIATVLANPAYRPAPTSGSKFNFYEAAEGRPAALRTWFYPGDTSGFEFILRPGPGGLTAQQHGRSNDTTGTGGASND